MAFSFGDFGSALSGVGSAVGAAGDVASLFRGAPNAPSNQMGHQGQIVAPAYSFGAGTLTRRNNDFLTGQRRLRDVIGGLRSQVRPGFGQLTETGLQAIRNRAAQASGNLRANMARRGLLGASFAEDTNTRLESEYQQIENEFRAQAFQEEMRVNNQLIEQEQASLLAQANQELGELGIATSFLSGVKQAALTQAQIKAALAREKLQEEYFSGQVQTPAAPAAPTAPATPAAPAPRPATPPRPPRFGAGFGGGRR